ncbi:MAG: HAD family hydrolase, partial [Sphingomonas sp.]
AFHDIRREEDARVMREGVASVDGAIEFVLRLPPALPKAIASSSATPWITAHLAHIGLQEAFGAMIFSGKEHVARGKPAPDLYLYAAQQLGIAIDRTVIIEDSPVGVMGAVASGAHVIGLCAGLHCGPDHAARLRALGVHDVARDFAEVARLIA